MIIERNHRYLRVKIDISFLHPDMARFLAERLVALADEIEPRPSVGDMVTRVHSLASKDQGSDADALELLRTMRTLYTATAEKTEAAEVEEEIRRGDLSTGFFELPYEKLIEKTCPQCGGPVQSTPLTPPDLGTTYGCTICRGPRSEPDPEPEDLAVENQRLRAWVSDLQSGMYVNCVYCGHRYGPRDEAPVSMAKVLKEHISKCPKHPLSKALTERDGARGMARALRAEAGWEATWAFPWEKDVVVEGKPLERASEDQAEADAGRLAKAAESLLAELTVAQMEQSEGSVKAAKELANALREHYACKEFKNLEFLGSHDNLCQFPQFLESRLPDGWTRSTEFDNLIVFVCDKAAGRRAAKLCLMFRQKNALYVSNIVPEKAGDLSFYEYNQILEEFAEIAGETANILQLQVCRTRAG